MFIARNNFADNIFNMGPGPFFLGMYICMFVPFRNIWIAFVYAHLKNNFLLKIIVYTLLRYDFSKYSPGEIIPVFSHAWPITSEYAFLPAFEFYQQPWCHNWTGFFITSTYGSDIWVSLCLWINFVWLSFPNNYNLIGADGFFVRSIYYILLS